MALVEASVGDSSGSVPKLDELLKVGESRPTVILRWNGAKISS